MIGWPRGTLAQFAYIGAVGAALGLLLFVILGFRNDWNFPVDPYRERYFFDDSSVHTTDWEAVDVGDVDADGASDLLVSLPFDPETEACRMSAWILSGRTGRGLMRLAISEHPDSIGVGSVGGCSGFGIEPLGERQDGSGPAVALSSLLDSQSRGVVFDLSLRNRQVVQTHRGEHDWGDFGWAAACVGDLDVDGTDDLVVSSRVRDLVQARSRTTGATLWSLEVPEVERLGADKEITWDVWQWVDEICRIDDLDGDGVSDIGLGSRGAAWYRGSVLLVSGRSGKLLARVDGEPEPRWGVPSTSLGSPLEAIPDQDGDGTRDLLVGALTRPSRILSARSHVWIPLSRSLYRARSGGDVDGDGHVDFVGSEHHFWDPEEIVIVSGIDGRFLRRIRPESGFRFLSDWRSVGDQDGDGREDLAVVSDNELDSWWLSYSWSPGFGAVTVYSGKDGTVLRRVDRDTLIGVARAGVDLWEIR